MVELLSLVTSSVSRDRTGPLGGGSRPRNASRLVWAAVQRNLPACLTPTADTIQAVARKKIVHVLSVAPDPGGGWAVIRSAKSTIDSPQPDNELLYYAARCGLSCTFSGQRVTLDDVPFR